MDVKNSEHTASFYRFPLADPNLASPFGCNRADHGGLLAVSSPVRVPVDFFNQ